MGLLANRVQVKQGLTARKTRMEVARNPGIELQRLREQVDAAAAFLNLGQVAPQSRHGCADLPRTKFCQRARNLSRSVAASH